MCSAALPKGGISPAPLPRWHCRYRQRGNRPGGRGTGPGPRHYRTFRPPAARRHGGAFAGRSPLCGCHPPLRGGSHQKHPRRRQRSRGRVPPPAARRQHLARGQCGAGQCRPGRAVFSRNAGQCSAHHRRQGACGLCRAVPPAWYPRVLPTVAGITACEGAASRTATSLPCRGPLRWN